MQTCSNCGAAARPGAKFCTSCGARLPIVPTAGNSGWGENANQTQQTPAWDTSPANGQQTPSEPVTAGVNASATAEQPVMTEGEAATDVEADASSSTATPSVWSWGQSPTDESTVPPDDTTATEDRQEAGDETSDAAASEPSWISSWSATSSSSNATPGTDERTGAGVTDETAAASSDETQPNEAAETVGQQGTENVDADAQPEWMRNLAANQSATSAATAPDETTSATEAAATSTTDDGNTPDGGAVTATTGDAARSDASVSSAEQTDTSSGTTAGETSAPSADGHNEAATIDESMISAAMEAGSTAPAAAATAPMTPALVSSDALTEAEGLLDRLQALLPALAAPAPATPGIDVSDIADQLQQAADQNAKSEFDDLGSVLEAAREHPRDVDTMLTLVTRIDPLLALLHAHGNLLTAINEAVTELRDGNQGP